MRVPPMPATLMTFALLVALGACSRSEPDKPVATTRPGSAATATPPVREPMPAVSSGASLATLEKYLQAWNAHDARRAAEFLTEDSEYFDAAFAGRQLGRAAIEENAIAVFMRGLPDLQWEMRSEPIVDATGIAYEWTLTGTNSGTWGGIPATNQKISLKGMSFVRFRGGKISYQAVVYDSATLNRQLGL